MNRRTFLKNVGIASLAALIVPKELFSEKIPEGKKITEDTKVYEFNVVNTGNKIYSITPFGKHGLQVNKNISLIRFHSESNSIGSVNRIFKLNQHMVIPSYDGCCMQFAPPSSSTPYSTFVSNINQFEFDFLENDVIKVSLFPAEN